jgi:hypothetical protein
MRDAVYARVSMANDGQDPREVQTPGATACCRESHQGSDAVGAVALMGEDRRAA